jgi:hypothetical protein
MGLVVSDPMDEDALDDDVKGLWLMRGLSVL